MEQLEMFYKLGSGPDFDELDSALEAISAINPGDHYLGTAHTLANFETAFYLPELMNSDSYEQWDLEGAKDANQRGLEKAGQLLDQYERPPIDPSVDEAISDYVARRERELPEMYL